MLCSRVTLAQCPENIGFDYGDFTNWTGYTGSISPNVGIITLNATGIVSGRHTIFYSKDNQIDPYGKFPIVSPNGSSCCVRLGNSNTHSEAERLSYTLIVPQNSTDYSLIYYYAVVLQSYNHPDNELPRFTAKVFDVTDNKYSDCGSFDYIAGTALPGFQQSPKDNTVYYKTWSPVTINLLGLSGKTIRLEFTTNDCSQGGHFGYAYLDVNQNCTSPVSGNIYCSNTTGPITLQAPAGFKEYYWYNASDLTTPINTTNILTINPAPAIGSKFAVRIVPFPGYGCEDTIFSTIQASEPLVLNVKPIITECKLSSINLTDSTVTAGSNADFTYTYYTDAACTNNLIGPQKVTASGTYYIKATSPGGCFLVSPTVLMIGQATLSVTDPPPVCVPATVDITAAGIATATAGSTYTYWKDALATIKVNNASAIDSAGKYYIKASTAEGCTAIRPVNVTINQYPTLVINNPPQTCINTDINIPAITAGSSSGATYTYFTDSLCTAPIPDPKNIGVSGTYYIKATVPGGCYVIAPVKVIAPEVLNLQLPVNITVCKIPGLDLTKPIYTTGSNADFTYTYFSDPLAVNQLIDPTNITISGTYYVKATTPIGCNVIKPVQVTVLDMPDITITNPPPVCQPATIDVTASVTMGPSFAGTLSYWKDAGATITLPKPKVVDSTGTYYVKAVNANGCPIVEPVFVTVNKLPKLKITDQSDCSMVDITTAKTTLGSSGGLTYSYWLDSTATKLLTAPQAITVSGRYYIGATTSQGCMLVKPVNVIVYLPPALIKIATPAAVVYPTVVDLKTTFTPQYGDFYTFWADSSLTKVMQSSLVTKGGTYYIKEANSYNCYNKYPVTVTVNKPPDIDFSVNVFTPNNDGVNDGFKFKVPFYVTMKSFKIYNGYGQLLFETTDANKYWDGKNASKLVPVGTYYWIFTGHDNYSDFDIKKSGSVTVVR